MGLWSAYFFAKLLLYARGDLNFDPWLNLGFAVFTALTPSNGHQRLAKNLVALPVGVLLLYHDSVLPPLAEITPSYAVAFIYRSFSWIGVAAFAGLIALYSLARRKLRLSTFVFIGIVWVDVASSTLLLKPTAARAGAGNTREVTTRRAAAESAPEEDARSLQPQALESRLNQFYEQQGSQRVHFKRPADEGTPYDILILQVSSLSWDDLQAIKRNQDPLIGRFDIVFSRFNSAASDATPAKSRMLRGGCGQTTEKQLYDPPKRECLTLDALQQSGFEPHWLANVPSDEGLYDSVRQQGEMPGAPEHIKGAVVTQIAPDGSAVFDDYSILSRWAKRRAANSAARVVLYYNSVSLDDGNRPLGGVHRHVPYAERLATFSSGVNRFIDDMQRSGRHAIVLVIAEHGAALGGDPQQMSGLREIPTPSIARVPVGVIFVNKARSANWKRARIDASTSYLAVSELIARFIANNPFENDDVSLDRYVASLPQTEFVAEHEGITVMQVGKRYLMRSPDGSWSALNE